jgi:hypothetical protein
MFEKSRRNLTSDSRTLWHFKQHCHLPDRVAGGTVGGSFSTGLDLHTEMAGFGVVSN